jgi:hypothetical protein
MSLSAVKRTVIVSAYAAAAEWITMTAREQRRAHLAGVIAGELKLWEAAVVLGLSIRRRYRASAYETDAERTARA